MKTDELARYVAMKMDASHGAGRIQCWLCGQVLAAGDPCLLVPADCNETEKMDLGAPYSGLWAHRSCMERIL